MGRGDDMISPEIQRDAIDSYAARNNIEIVAEIPDIDRSGRSFTKRRVNEVIEGINDGRWEYVLLYKWSRWGRNLKSSLIHLSAVEAAGGVVRAATEDFDPTTTMGRFTRDQMLLIAELQSNQIADAWRDTHTMRRREGLPHDGKTRWGYDYAKGPGYTVHDEQGPVLADAYERYVAGESIRGLALGLNARGIRAPRGGLWTATKLASVMDTGFAAGLIREKSDIPGQDRGTKPKSHTITAFDQWRDGRHPAIISRELWEAYKGKRSETAGKAPRHRVAAHALSGLLKCGEPGCGATMLVHHRTNRSSFRWACPRARASKAHPYNSVGNTRAVRDVLAWVTRTAEGGQDVTEQARRFARAQEASGLAKRYQAEIDRLVAKRSRLADAYTDGLVEKEDYENQRRGIAEALAVATGGLAVAKAREAAAGVEVIRAFGPLRDEWDRLTPHGQREALASVVSRIVIHPGPYSPSKVECIPAWEE